MAILVAALSGAAVASSLDHASSADRDPGLTSGETALDLTGVAPLNQGAGSPPRVSAPRFEPPEPGKPRVMDLDVDTLFAALVNHTVRASDRSIDRWRRKARLRLKPSVA